MKGSDNLSNFQSDLANSGGSAWESISSNASDALTAVQSNPMYAGYQTMSDGHSLGGGMAQTFALENGLSGYGQNSLPISSQAQNDSAISDAGGVNATHFAALYDLHAVPYLDTKRGGQLTRSSCPCPGRVRLRSPPAVGGTRLH